MFVGFVTNIRYGLATSGVSQSCRQFPGWSLLQELAWLSSTLRTLFQGGRSCAGARGAPAEKFGLGRKF